MPDYKEAYLTLFRAMTKATKILQDAQSDTEELCIAEEPPALTVLPFPKPEEAGEQED